MPVLVAAPDKFRGTLTAPDAAAAMARGAAAASWTCDEAPVADGGEGLLDVLGGAVRRERVSGPHGDAVDAEWRLAGTTAVIESARAAGLLLAGGAGVNDAVAATTAGVGELISAAVATGAREVIVGVGGSATTDGGWGCIEALQPLGRLKGVSLVVACDVTTRFVDAAAVFAPQKGATPAQVRLLERRLERLAQLYVDRFGVDVRDLVGGGAAGGLAGGLAAVGARLVPGFDLVAERVGLAERIAGADVVVTGEGFVDAQSFEGKAVGGVLSLCAAAGKPALLIAGDVDGAVAAHPSLTRAGVEVVSLVDSAGAVRAEADAAACVEEAVRRYCTRIT